MEKEINRILTSFELILKENKSKITEVSASSDSLLGGNVVKIPRAGAHAGQSGWQSANAWDIMAKVGTPVYALANGTAITFNDYGKNVTQTQGKKLYGQSFTVQSEQGLPSLYYTHLQNSPIRKGSKISCGQFLGYIMDFPNSDSDHVHIGIERGDISQFLTPDGKLKCGGKSITGEVPNTMSQDQSGYGDKIQSTEPESSYGRKIVLPEPESSYGRKVYFENTLKESFGNNTRETYGVITIPASTNSTIYSPVDGKVVRTPYNLTCKNNILIKLKDNSGYLNFCNMTNPKKSVGDSVSIGSTIGKTSDDVEVTFYDNSFSRKKINNEKFSTPRKKGEDDMYSTKDYKKTPTYYDPLMAMIPSTIANMFSNKLAKDGKPAEKRIGYVTDKKDVDPWIVNSLSKPFKKVGKILGTNKVQERKIQENIKRIKKLL